MNISDRPVAVDVFAGAGGLSEGLLAAGINVAVAVEHHPHAALTHAFNHPGTTVVCADMRSLDTGFLRSKLRARTGKLCPDILVGGPPCQGFSPAGKQNPDDPRNELVNEYIRIAKDLKPRVVLFENVPGFATQYNGVAMQKLLDSLWSLGYTIKGIATDSDSFNSSCLPILNAAHYGVPQQRKRLLLIGFLSEGECHSFRWPRKRFYSEARGGEPSDSVNKGASTFTSVSEAIEDLAFLESGYEASEYAEAPTTDYQRNRRRNSTSLFNHLATDHRPSTVSVFRQIEQGKTIGSVPSHLRSRKQRMRRLDEHSASFAVLALPDDYVHYQQHRILTVREMARLQSFDDDYVFFGKRTTSDVSRRVDVPQYTQVGNAVPPLLAKLVGNAIAKVLGFKPKDLRDLSIRRRRHEWISGSSGYDGYSLSFEAEGQLDLIDNNGSQLGLPLARHAGEPQPALCRWATKARRRTTRPSARLLPAN